MKEKDPKEIRLELVKAFAHGGIVPTEEHLNEMLDWIVNGRIQRKTSSKKTRTKDDLRTLKVRAGKNGKVNVVVLGPRTEYSPEPSQYDNLVIRSPEFKWPEGSSIRRVSKIAEKLSEINITTVGELRRATYTDVLSCPWLGKGAVEILQSALAGYNITW